MRLFKRIVSGLLVVFLLIAGLFLTFIGPWPAYTSSFENTAYFNRNLQLIDQAATLNTLTDQPDALLCGWGVANLNPPKGVPLAGLSAREGAPSTGIHDDVFVKAVAFSDGEDTAVIVGADMLLIPTNVADLVREAVARETPLQASNIFFTASHSHNSVGAFAPGLIASISFGPYDPAVPPVLAEAFTKAVLDAYNSLAPAKFAQGAVDATDYIRNRTRDAGVDPLLNWMMIEKEGGERCVMTRFSAHPTILNSSTMEVSAEFPGYLQRRLEEKTGATAVYLGGAVGSMSPRAPQAEIDFEKCELLGHALAELVLDATEADLDYTDRADVASVGASMELPSLQVRLFSPNWRLSPLVRHIVGLSNRGWVGAVKVGDVLFVNTPGDFSGEIAADWQDWGEAQGLSLWVSGFSGDYAGYISPDKYYHELFDHKGRLSYETGQLSWLGPHMESFFTTLMEKMVDVMHQPAPALVAAW